MNFTKLILSLFICVVIGSLSGIFVSSDVSNWYSTLIKPSFSPPIWLYTPVWTLLSIFMGLALYQYWNKKFAEDKIRSKKTGYIFFSAVLVLHFLWALFFFKVHSPVIALIDILLVLVAILISLYYFIITENKAGYLLLPMLIWLSFICYLNWNIIKLN